MRNTAVTSQEIDTLYENRGEVDADGTNWDSSSNYHDAISWKEQGKFNAIMGQERREYLDKQKALLTEELERL